MAGTAASVEKNRAELEQRKQEKRQKWFNKQPKRVQELLSILYYLDQETGAPRGAVAMVENAVHMAEMILELQPDNDAANRIKNICQKLSDDFKKAMDKMCGADEVKLKKSTKSKRGKRKKIIKKRKKAAKPAAKKKKAKTKRKKAK